MQLEFHVHGWLRMSFGSVCIAAAAWMVLSGHDLGWGLSYSVVVPACILMFPGLALVKRKLLRLQDQKNQCVEIETGWIWRHVRSLTLIDCQLELVPMAGLWAVIIHRGDQEFPLLTWLRRSQAEAAICFLNQVAPDGQWPRIQREQAEWDR